MTEPITSKSQMYDLLAAGRLGNTIRSFHSVDEWEVRGPEWNSPLWGVRSLMAGDPRAKLDVPTDVVADYCRSEFGAGGFNITPMVDRWLVWRGEVWDTPNGLECHGVYGLRELKWRPAMSGHAVTTRGSAARALLRHVLNENSHDDLMCLLGEYPDHCVELTAMDRCYGTVPHRNACVWEVRCAGSGEYELSTWRRFL